MTNQVNQSVLYASDSRGIYIPQHFAESACWDQFEGWNEGQRDVLLSGPDHESYWDVWQEVLDNVNTVCGGVLYQDGDLWIIWPQLAIDAINSLCEDQEEYETRHGDAGDNYAHMVAESWTESCHDRLAEQMSETVLRGGDCSDPEYWKGVPKYPKLDPRWKELDPDVLDDMALDSFTMQAGSIWGPYGGGIVLAGYPVGEVEIELDYLGIDGVTMDYIRESCDPYISDCGRAYIDTDSAWFAVLDIDTMNASISQHFEDA